MSWKNSIILGVLIGSALGLVTYSTLSRIGSEAMLQSVYVPQTLHTERGCGLEPMTACYSLAYIYYASLVQQNELPEVTSESLMQPFGQAPEDELTATQRLQTTHSPQVSRHGVFLQNAPSKGVQGGE